MRPNTHFSITGFTLLALLAGCASHAGARRAADASPNATPTIPPLQSCETREFRYRGADVVVVANADRSVASLTVIASRSPRSRARALREIETQLGTPHPDTRIEQRPWKDGLVELTDPCGRLVTPSPTPT